MSIDHSRYFEIVVGDSKDTNKKETDSLLKIILFKDDRKLRSHTVKHFANLDEFESAWKSIKSVDFDLIMQSVTSLQRIGCLYYELGSEVPPCNACRLFNKCSGFIDELEKEYIRSAVSVIEECGRIPRHVFYLSSTEHIRLFFAIPDLPVVVKAAVLRDDIFNLMTFYSRANMSFTEMRDLEVRKISIDANKNTISWCNDSSWGLNGMSSVSDSGKNGFKKANKKRKKLNPYKRGGSKNYKQYLDEYEDW